MIDIHKKEKAEAYLDGYHKGFQDGQKRFKEELQRRIKEMRKCELRG